MLIALIEDLELTYEWEDKFLYIQVHFSTILIKIFTTKCLQKTRFRANDFILATVIVLIRRPWLDQIINQFTVLAEHF